MTSVQALLPIRFSIGCLFEPSDEFLVKKMIRAWRFRHQLKIDLRFLKLLMLFTLSKINVKESSIRIYFDVQLGLRTPKNKNKSVTNTSKEIWKNWCSIS